MILIIGGSGLRKTNGLVNWRSDEPNIDNPFKSKYQLLTFKRKEIGTRKFKDSRTFIEYSGIWNKNLHWILRYMKHVYPNLDDCNPNRKPKISILFDYMISEILSHKKPEQTVTELFILFIHCSKLNTSNVFIKQSYFGFQHVF